MSLRQPSWGGKRVAAGVAVAAAFHVLALSSIGVVASALGHSASFRDAGDLFTKLSDVAVYTDELLRAVAAGGARPEPPALLGDVVTARIAYLVAVANLVVLAGIVLVASGRGPRALFAELGLRGYSFEAAWRPILAAAIATVGLAAYAVAIRAVDIDILEPGSAAPGAVLRDGWAFALFAVVTIGMAPVVEELFFRGLVFGGLLRFGPWAAALASALLFAAWHLDVAAIIPVTAVGLVLAGLFWWTGNLWDSIVFHIAFNAVSFVQFAGGQR
jgi:membrane protease YdiL (CAAX protease family)